MWTVVILSLWSLSQIHWVPLIKDCQSYFWFCVTTIICHHDRLSSKLLIKDSFFFKFMPLACDFDFSNVVSSFQGSLLTLLSTFGMYSSLTFVSYNNETNFFACFILLKFLSKHIYTHVHCSKTFMVFKGLNIHNFLFVISIPKQYVRE